MLKVDTILSAFSWMVQLLDATAAKHTALAAQHQHTIDEATAAKALAETEAQRATAASAKLRDFLV